MKTDLALPVESKAKFWHESQINKVATMLYGEAACLIGQKNINDNVSIIGISHFAKHIEQKMKGYTISEIRDAIKYGQSQDKTIGGAISAQRIIFWCNQYHNIERPRLYKLKQLETKPEPKKIDVPKKISDQFIIDKFHEFKRNKKALMLSRCYDRLIELGAINLTDEQKWDLIDEAVKNFKTIHLENPDLFTRRKAFLLIETYKRNKPKTVSTNFIVDAQSLAVANYFESLIKKNIEISNELLNLKQLKQLL